MERDDGTRQTPPRLDPSTMTLVCAPGRWRVKDVGHQGVSMVANANGAGGWKAPPARPAPSSQPPGERVSWPSVGTGPSAVLQPPVSMTLSE